MHIKPLKLIVQEEEEQQEIEEIDLENNPELKEDLKVGDEILIPIEVKPTPVKKVAVKKAPVKKAVK